MVPENASPTRVRSNVVPGGAFMLNIGPAATSTQLAGTSAALAIPKLNTAASRLPVTRRIASSSENSRAKKLVLWAASGNGRRRVAIFRRGRDAADQQDAGNDSRGDDREGGRGREGQPLVGGVSVGQDREGIEIERPQHQRRRKLLHHIDEDKKRRGKHARTDQRQIDSHQRIPGTARQQFRSAANRRRHPLET